MKKSIILLLLSIFAFGDISLFAQQDEELIIYPADRKTAKPIKISIDESERPRRSHTLETDFPKKYAEYDSLLYTVKNPEISDAFTFLMTYAPLSDLADYSTEFMLTNAMYAVRAKHETPWGNTIPEHIFKHFVLPPRVNNENLDSFRIVMYQDLLRRVKHLPMYKAALEVNHWCHERVTYQASDGRTSAPLSTIRYSFGRCGEESTLLVAALRTAGIPARQVYTPRWAHTDDNHAWVEVWVDGKWYFMGACEPSPELNMGWFAVPSTRTMFVNTRVFGRYNGEEPGVVQSEKFSELNLISNYTKTKEVEIKVVDEKSQPVKGALVEFQLYNYAEFFTLTKSETDENGIAKFKTGYGDLIIWASKGDAYGFSKLDRKATELTLKITDKPAYKPMTLDIIPPDEGEPVKVKPENKALCDSRIHKEDEMRAKYMATFPDSVNAKKYIEEENIKSEPYVDYLVRSYGNWKEILNYIKMAEEKYPNEAANYILLSVISAKDLRDTKAEILMSHLASALQLQSPKYSLGDWANYILNPRIRNENMLAWRGISYKLAKISGIKHEELLAMSNFEKVMTISDFINNRITIDNVSNTHSRSPITPLGMFNIMRSDDNSRDIFFVALLRDLGVPARLNPGTAVPQFYDDEKKQWIDNNFNKVKSKGDYGFVSFVNKSKLEPKYYSNFTIRRLEGGRFHTYEFDDIMPISEMPDKLEVPTGKYMLVTGNRKMYGDVLATISYFDVTKGKTTKVDVKMRDIPKASDPWMVLNTKSYQIEDMNSGKSQLLSNAINGKDFILAIIEPDKEPTKHFMADLKLLQAHAETKKMPLIFLLEKKDSQTKPNISLFKNTPNAIFAWDFERNILNKLEDYKREELGDNLPIVIYGKANGKLFYFNKGYKIGIIDEIIKIIK